MRFLSRVEGKSMSRRDFLRVTGGAGIGLVINMAFQRPAAAQGSGAAAATRSARAVAPALRICS